MTKEEAIAKVNASGIADEEKNLWRWSFLMQSNTTMMKLGLDEMTVDAFNPADFSSEIAGCKSW